jgi:outer membrane protein assembly factor BamB
MWVIDAGVAASLAVSPGSDPVVVVGRDSSPVLQAYRVADGSRVWRTRHYDDPRDIVALDGRFVLRDSDRTTALDAATGAPVWSWTQARTWAATGGGDRVLLLTDTELVLLDGAGRQVRSWPHSLGDVSQSATFLTAAEGTVVAYGPLSMSVGRLP